MLSKRTGRLCTSRSIGEDFVQPIWKPITRQNNPSAFWTVILFGALCEVVFVSLAVTHFLTWL